MIIKNKKIFNLLSGLAFIYCVSAANAVQAQPNNINDANITLQIKSKLAIEKNIPSNEISVKTNDGIVILEGVLPTSKQASSAVEIAESVSGVRDIKTSNLKVRGSKQPLTDSYITAKIKGLFLREKICDYNPNVAMSIKVETKNGLVYLSGTVNNADKETTAINLAKQIEGVVGVKSLVKIK